MPTILGLRTAKQLVSPLHRQTTQHVARNVARTWRCRCVKNKMVQYAPARRICAATNVEGYRYILQQEPHGIRGQETSTSYWRSAPHLSSETGFPFYDLRYLFPISGYPPGSWIQAPLNISAGWGFCSSTVQEDRETNRGWMDDPSLLKGRNFAFCRQHGRAHGSRGSVWAGLTWQCLRPSLRCLKHYILTGDRSFMRLTRCGWCGWLQHRRTGVGG
jgi:hypothetical protein